MDNFESYINAKDFDYDSGYVTFTGYVYKLNTPQFKIVKQSAYAKDTISLQENVEYHGQNCYIPTSGHCFIKCVKVFYQKRLYRRIYNFHLMRKKSIRKDDIC